MKNLRIFLWAGLAMIILVNYQTWMVDAGKQNAMAAASAAANPPAPLDSAIR